MKKVLFGTTALVAASMVGTAAQAAEPIKLSVGGFMNQWVAFVDKDDVSPTTVGNTNKTDAKYNSFGITSDTEIHFKGSTTLDNGLKVAVTVELEAERTASSTGRNADQQFVTLSGGWGQVRVGEMFNAATIVHNQAPKAGASYADMTANLMFGPGTSPQLASGRTVTGLANGTTSVDGISDRSQTSIDYISPMFGPFAFGITYVPALGGVGAGPGRGIVEEHTTVHDLVGGALVYADKWGPVSINADVAYARWDANGLSTSTFALAGGGQAIPVGLVIGYAGFEVGGSYIRIWDSYKNHLGLGGNTLASMEGYAWDAGIAYTTGPWKFGYQYYSSQLAGGFGGNNQGVDGGHDSIQFHNLGGQYTMGPGVVVTANVGYLAYQDERALAADKSDNVAVVTGLKLTF